MRKVECGKQLVDGAFGNHDCAAYNDFRELTRRSDIDAVFICSPDHWHVLIALDEMRHGHDVYIEKPLTLTISEGRARVDAARRCQRVAQHGTQHRSLKGFRDLAQFVRNGGLGKLESIDVAIPPNNRFCSATWSPEPGPAVLDWEMWLGPPPPWRPYTSAGAHYNFRFTTDNAYGQLTNWGAGYSLAAGERERLRERERFPSPPRPVESDRRRLMAHSRRRLSGDDTGTPTSTSFSPVRV